MKFLCLHGIGTNSKIFKMQTAAFRYELGDQHTYEFVQGTVPWGPPTELTMPSDPSNQYYAYYDIASPTSFVAALENLEAYIEAEGPFDGVMAYSQGAGLAAMLLVRQQYLQPGANCFLRCAIFFSPVQVYDPAAYSKRGEVCVLNGLVPGMAPLPLPVVIIFGEADEKKHECLGVKAVCDPFLVSVFCHEGGHEVPGIRIKNGLLGSIKVARQGVFRAELALED